LELRPEILAEDLAHRVLRQLGQETDDLRLLEARQPLAAEFAEALGGHRLSRPEHDTPRDPLTPLQISQPAHRRPLDTRMRLQDRLDLGGRDVLASADDHVVLASRDEEVTLLVLPPHVPRREPAIAERRLGAARVSLHDPRCADADLTDLSRAER